MFGRNSRFRWWSLAHPVRFAALGGVLLALLLFISLGTWTLHHPLRVAMGFPFIWATWGLIFWLMTKAKPTTKT
jgi:hypothetical protein